MSNCFQPHYSGKSNQNFLCNSGADEAEKATKAGTFHQPRPHDFVKDLKSDFLEPATLD